VLVIKRKVSGIPVPEPLTLTTVIFTAPPNLLINGYFSSFEVRNEAIVYMLFALAVIFYIFVTVKMLTSFLRVKFYPTYSAFTFPYVISALAFRHLDGFLTERGVTFFAPVATVTMWIAGALVFYVFIRYVCYFRGSVRASAAG
jgi:exfoliative toxin A/B